MINADLVCRLREKALWDDPEGLFTTWGPRGPAGLDASLDWVDDTMYYEGVTDPFEIAALYARAIAKGHPFGNGNKRTGLACALTYLDGVHGIYIRRDPELVKLTDDLAQGKINYHQFAAALRNMYEGDLDD